MDYYAEQLEIGEAYERFVVEQLRARGVSIARCEGRTAQLALGDTTIGLEIKCDRKLVKTKNLYIEVAEKRDVSRRSWVPSGIEAASTARWYGIGDRREMFIFLRERLRWIRGLYPEIEIDRGTSRGFLLPKTDARNFAVRYLQWSE